ncbi:bifunctional Prolyl 4-hydroxylase alpha subunit [Babesia duncani]|uniref:Bifunctional Prolyl 4-hydroxylase alpha subunit n=1 Tax=Babesia duncani TaxID=323732 RepID=A0AAD9PJY3_9APIC|nr:bifunctional Prolyl 4-hydroxylase alpha subunit [Babesia duncani]
MSVIFDHSETATISNIENRIALIAGIDVCYLEKLVMVKYEPGDYFSEHHDGAFRTHTILLYLNDAIGGETIFPNLSLAVLPISNCALFWKNLNEKSTTDFNMIHAGTSPLWGQKYIVNCFFNIKPVR